MCNVVGYARISRKTQSIERQIRNIHAVAPECFIYQEAFTGTKVEGRKQFDAMRKAARDGKIKRIIFDSVSRMSRNAVEGFALYQEFYNEGVELVFIKEPHINTEVYKDAAEKQIETIQTGDAATDELMQAITDGVNRYMMRLAEKQIMIAFEQAEKEVSDLHQRTVEGLQTAVLVKGKTLGRPKGVKPVIKKEAPAKEAIRKYSQDFDGNLDDVECIKLVGVSRNTYYKYKREIRETM